MPRCTVGCSRSVVPCRSPWRAAPCSRRARKPPVRCASPSRFPPLAALNRSTAASCCSFPMMGRPSRGRRRIRYRANSTKPIFGVDVDGLAPGADVVIDDTIVGWPARSLKDIPPGDYFVQALLNRYETFHRADGHTIKMPMDQGEGQHWESKPGNFYSKPVKMHIDAASGGEIRISMDQEIPPIAPPHDTAQVKYLRVQNERLSEVLGPADVSRRHRVPAAGLGHASQRSLSPARPSRPLSEGRRERRLARNAARLPTRAGQTATTRLRRTSSSRTGTARNSLA